MVFLSQIVCFLVLECPFHYFLVPISLLRFIIISSVVNIFSFTPLSIVIIVALKFLSDISYIRDIKVGLS